jgi:hypothetical protein
MPIAIHNNDVYDVLPMSSNVPLFHVVESTFIPLAVPADAEGSSLVPAIHSIVVRMDWFADLQPTTRSGATTALLCSSPPSFSTGNRSLALGSIHSQKSHDVVVQDVVFLLGRQVIGVLNDADRIPERLFRTLWLEATKEEESVAAWPRCGG